MLKITLNIYNRKSKFNKVKINNKIKLMKRSPPNNHLNILINTHLILTKKLYLVNRNNNLEIKYPITKHHKLNHKHKNITNT